MVGGRSLLVVGFMSCLAVALAGVGPASFNIDEWEGHDRLQQPLRQILQTKNGTTPSPSPSGGDSRGAARVTGALALYSLFGLFVFSSVTTVIIGIIASVQWPNPRVCCYRTPHSDVPSSDSCTCCALHRLNIGFAVTWLALLVLLVLAFVIYLMAAAAVLAVVHSAVAYRLVRQLKMSYAANAQMAQMVETRQPAAGLVTGVVIERPLPGVPLPGIAVVDIPLLVAVVDSRLMTQIGFEQTAVAAAVAAAAAAGAGGGSNGGSGGGAAAAAGAAAVGAGAAGVVARAGSATKRTASAERPLSPAGSGLVASAASGPGARAGAGSAAASPAAAAAPAVPVALVVDERIVPPGVGVGAVPQRPPPPPPGETSPGGAGQAGATSWGSGEAPLPHRPPPAAVGAAAPAVAVARPSGGGAAGAAAGGVVGPADVESSYPLLQPPGAAARVRAGPELSAEVPPQHHGLRVSGSGGGAAGGGR